MIWFENEWLPEVTFEMREKVEGSEGTGGCVVEGANPYKWAPKKTSELFAGKRVLIFGLPGAFTPTCSNSQLPGYEALYDEFTALGVDEIWCTSVNDAFVMFKWAEDIGAKRVRMLPDGNGDFAKALGHLVDKQNLGFGKRSWRYAMYVDNMKIKNEWAEDGFMNLCPADPYEKSAPEYVIGELKKYLTLKPENKL